MRILGVTHNYPRHDGDIAGAFLERLAVALVRRGHAVEMVTPADQGAAGRAAQGGVTVTRFRYAPAAWETLAHRGTMAAALRSPRGLLALGSLVAAQARALRASARAARPDVVHAHWWIPGGISAWLAHGRLGAPYVVTLHGTDAEILRRSGPARTVARRVLRGAAAVTAVSTYVASRAAEVAGLDPADVLVQPMPLDTDRFTRPSRGGGGIVTVGRLTAQKRVDLILDALAALARRGRARDLTVVGDGPERGALEARAARLGVADRVRFTGYVEPAQVPEALGDADVCAFTAVGEGFGLAAAEALALGIPVVALDSGGGVTDIVPRTGAGRVMPAGDAEALAGALDELARAPDARRLAAELGADLKRRLSPDAVAAAFEALFARLPRQGADA